MTWLVKKLGEVCDFRVIKNTKFLPYVGMEDVESNTGKFIGKRGLWKVKSSTAYFDQTCVLYGKLRPYLNKVFVPDFEGHSSTEFVPLKPDQKLLAREWLSMWLMSSFVVEEMSKNVAGARMPRANLDHLKSLKIPLPSLVEQKRIIAKLEKMLAKIKEAKRLRAESLVATESLLSAELHKIFEDGRKKGWEEKAVDEISNAVQYGYTASAREKGNAQLLRITDIQNRSVNWDLVPFCQCDDVEKYRLYDGDIVFARTGATVGKSYLIQNPPRNAVFASYLIRVGMDRKQCSPELLYYFFQSTDYWNQVIEHAVGGAQPNVNGSKLKRIKIFLPPLAEQKKIVARLDALSGKIQKLREYQKKTQSDLDRLEQSILQKAFSVDR